MPSTSAAMASALAAARVHELRASADRSALAALARPRSAPAQTRGGVVAVPPRAYGTTSAAAPVRAYGAAPAPVALRAGRRAASGVRAAARAMADWVRRGQLVQPEPCPTCG